MPKGKAIPPEVRRKIYNRFVMGESAADIAESLGLSEGGTRKIIRDERKAVEADMSSEKIVAGDKKNGRLLSTSDPHVYKGFCVINGKSKSKMFTTTNARKATELWERWCQELRDEDAFVGMCERRPATLATNGDRTVVLDEEGEPMDVDVRELLKEYDIDVDAQLALQKELADRIKELELAVEKRDARIAELEGRLSAPMEGVSEGKAPEPSTAYALMAVKPKLKGYRLFSDMDEAFAELERLNEVSRMLGMEDAFEVHEMEWGR